MRLNGKTGKIIIIEQILLEVDSLDNLLRMMMMIMMLIMAVSGMQHAFTPNALSREWFFRHWNVTVGWTSFYYSFNAEWLGGNAHYILKEWN